MWPAGPSWRLAFVPAVPSPRPRTPELLRWRVGAPLAEFLPQKLFARFEEPEKETNMTAFATKSIQPRMLSLSLSLFLACAPAVSPPASPAESEIAAVPDAQPAPVAAPATEQASPTATKSSRQQWPGLTGDELEWANTCSDAKDSTYATYCNSTGQKYEAKKDYATALAAYKLGCDAVKNPEPLACFKVGVFMLEGKATTKDVEGAFGLWEKACNLENGRDICGEIATAFESGRVVTIFGTNEPITKDAKRAKAFLNKACDGRDLTACKKLGRKPPQ